MQFTGVQIETKESEFIVHQRKYIEKLKSIESNGTYSDFRSLRAKLAWSTNTRPDISIAVALLAQITAEMFEKDKKEIIKRVNKVVHYLKKDIDLALRFPKLKKESLS